jgi:hypothetical protein
VDSYPGAGAPRLLAYAALRLGIVSGGSPNMRRTVPQKVVGLVELDPPYGLRGFGASSDAAAKSDLHANPLNRNDLRPETRKRGRDKTQRRIGGSPNVLRTVPE